jgi:hypothetical protein
MKPLSKSSPVVAALVLTLMASLAGCGGESPASNPDSGSPDSGPVPTISDTTPAAAATGVAVGSSLSVTFSEAMDPATFTASTFSVTGPLAAAVAGAVTYSGVTAVFKPAASLSLNTTYTATVTAAVKSAGGVALAASRVWTFTTASAPDTTPPSVSSTVPANAATGVSINGTVAITFSEALDPASVTTTTVALKVGTAAVAGAVAYAGVTATFTPAQALTATTSYTATVSGVKDLAGNALAAGYAFTFTTGATADNTPPTVSAVFPSGATTGIATNTAITATFSEAMTPATISTSSFTLSSPGPVAVAGSVAYTGHTATFVPAALLTSSTLFTATITTGSKDLAGNALAVPYTWTFTTGAAADTVAPTVSSTLPLLAASGVLTTASVKAVFSEAMAPLSVTGNTFTLTSPSSTAVAGSVVFDAPSKTATFQSTAALASSTTYTAKVRGGAGGVTDLAGNALASDYTWTFTTGSASTLSPVLLGTSINYVILAKTAISTVPTSAVTGDIGISPAAASFVTGFGLTLATGYATATQVVGHVLAADFADPTPITLTTAVNDMLTAYTDAAGRPTPDFLELGTGAIGGMTLTPGLYKWTNTVTIPSDVTLNGGATAVWIFQISGDLTQSNSTQVHLTGGALAKNVFWQVAGTVNVGTTAHFEGIILSQTAISLKTGASMNGRALAQTAVALDAATVTKPAP